MTQDTKAVAEIDIKIQKCRESQIALKEAKKILDGEIREEMPEAILGLFIGMIVIGIILYILTTL